MQAQWNHQTVLLDEAVQALAVAPEGHYVDATFGRGGHSAAILQRLGPQGRLTAFDKDPEAVAVARTLADNDDRFSIRHQGFAHLGELEDGSVDGVLMDLGVSSPQIDDPARGFSFRHDGPLDMRMDTTRGQSVAQWLETADVSTLTEVVKTREPGKDPATRTFQAFRIFINAELEELQQALKASLHVLRPGGRLVAISFHSLEDRMVKQFMASQSRTVVDRRAPFAEPAPMALADVQRVMPSAHEVEVNPRARSAVMRVATRTAAALPAGAGPKGGRP
ncbi:MAG: 16S rRNA (cytosine(1402)-N(4))-methyltransferase RsmH [Hydrogenophaga sp.]|nr:16S rRNA (cytosine(1402)-N(4))-methyltransferase RsmH [Hydrogenophaga sp.]